MPSEYIVSTLSLPLRSGYDTASPHEVVVGDFNGDGKLDLAFGYFLYPLENRGVPIRLLLGDGAGGFTDATSALFGGAVPTTVHSRETLVADFNGDGRADLFFADHGYDANPFPGAQNALVLSSGAGGVTNATFRLPQLSDYSHSAKAADIDGDGDIDIYVGNGGGGTAYTSPFFLINDGAGGFAKSQAGLPANLMVAGGPNHWSEAFIDVDGDGDLDLFLGSSLNTGSRLLLNDGHGVFSESGKVLPRGGAGADAVDIQVFDANGDGRPDLLVNYSVGTGPVLRQVQLLYNDGQGGFTDGTAAALPTAIQNGEWVRRINLADVNGDGHLDLVLNQGPTNVYLSDGVGHFIAMPGLLPGNQYDLVTPADVNGDGHTDFIAWRGVWDGAEQLQIDLWRDPGVDRTGSAAADAMMGDSRDSTIRGGEGNDIIVGGSGQDYLRGDEGDDRIAGGDAFDDINGNMGDDTCSGGEGGDWVVGGKDNDLLYGDGGGDVVWGNLGNDTCDGGDGDDQVRGGKGDDVVYGGAGNDWLSGDRGDDTVTGGSGADIFHTFDGAGLDRVTDFNAAEGDRVYLLPGTQFSVAQVGVDTVVTVTGAEGGQMVLVGVQVSTLPEGWIFGA